MTAPWYVVGNANEIVTPALLVYPDRVAENVRRMIAIAGGTKRLRPHVKTHKLAEIVRLQLDAGIDKFKVATIAEAEMVAGCGAADVLIAYQLIGPNVDRLVRLVEAFPGTRFSTLVDDAVAIDTLSQVVHRAGCSVAVLLDVDNGMGRTGVEAGPRAVELYRRIDQAPGLEPAGLHVYDGHRKVPDFDQRRAAVEADFEPVLGLRRELESSGLPVPQVVAGGTPTFPVHARHADRHCSPGTCVFWDTGYRDKLPDLDFLFAAVLLTRVVSKPSATRLCLDLGHKAVAADNPPPRVELFGLEGAQTVVHNEEHLAIDSELAGSLAVGDAVYGVPYHICPTVALHREVVVIEGGRAVDRWRVAARDRMLTI